MQPIWARRPSRIVFGALCAIVLLVGLRRFWRRNTPDSYIFTFGDSLTETHFSIENDHPTVSNPLGNGYPGVDNPLMTSSHGPNWLGYLIHSLLRSKTVSFNFAHGGAVIDAQLFPDPHLAAPDLNAQVHTFIDHLVRHRDFARWDSSNAAFVVWFGNNDIAGSYETADQGEFNRHVLESYFKQLDILHASGARKFVLATVFPLHLNAFFSNTFTEFPSDENASPLATDVRLFNDALYTSSQQWLASHTNSQIRYLDLQAVFRTMTDPSAARAAGVRLLDPKCKEEDREDTDDPTACLWRDSFHPGVDLHKEVARVTKGLLQELGIGRGSLLGF